MKRVYAYLVTGLTLASFSITNALATIPADVDTAISASQADVLSMIGKGFAYVGATTALMVVLAVFAKIIRKGKG